LLVGDILRTTAVRYPKKVGLVFGDKQYTWEQVNARVNSLARGLLGLGLKKQDKVAILCRNCNQYIEFYFATAKAGLVGVPLNTWFKGRELSYLIDNSGANTLVVDRNYLDIAQSLEASGVKKYIGLGQGHPYPYDFEALIAENSADEPEVEVDEDDLFVLSYTSGTTGVPKGAMITHSNACAGVISVALEWRLEPHHVYLLHAPMFFAAGGGARLHAVLRGCTCIIMTYNADAVLQATERERITHMSFSPTPIKRIIDYPDIDKYDLSSVKFIGLTGAPHSVAEIEKIEQIFGHVWCSAYGLAETVNCGTVLQPEEVEVEGPLAKRMGSVGKATIGIDLRVVDENGRDVAPDGQEVGEIILRGDSVPKGYLGMPRETAETVKEGWFYTGDMATVDEDGYIYIVDRKKDMIISGGINIYPREIEEIIYTHPAVSHCTVIGVPDEEWGETPKAVVVLREEMKATEDEIIDLCRQSLASYKKPTSVDFVDSLPMTPSGKILKREVLEQYWKGYEKRVH
jgi:long-chain acyl-CoA synthetase